MAEDGGVEVAGGRDGEHAIRWNGLPGDRFRRGVFWCECGEQWFNGGSFEATTHLIEVSESPGRAAVEGEVRWLVEGTLSDGTRPAGSDATAASGSPPGREPEPSNISDTHQSTGVPRTPPIDTSSGGKPEASISGGTPSPGGSSHGNASASKASPPSDDVTTNFKGRS